MQGKNYRLSAWVIASNGKMGELSYSKNQSEHGHKIMRLEMFGACGYEWTLTNYATHKN